MVQKSHVFQSQVWPSTSNNEWDVISAIQPPVSPIQLFWSLDMTESSQLQWSDSDSQDCKLFQLESLILWKLECLSPISNMEEQKDIFTDQQENWLDRPQLLPVPKSSLLQLMNLQIPIQLETSQTTPLLEPLLQDLQLSPPTTMSQSSSLNDSSKDFSTETWKQYVP